MAQMEINMKKLFNGKISILWRIALVIMLIGMFIVNPIGTSVSYAAVTVTRALPPTVSPGQTFDVTITFTAPANNFIPALTDFAPTGWTVAVDKTWCAPPPWKSNTVINKAEYLWSDPVNQGTAFTAVYKVIVPGDAPAGNYNFTNGTLEYYMDIAGTVEGPFIDNVTGASQVTIADTTAPTVVPPTIPANGATNVAVNTNIEVTFSEPMNQTATEAAFSSVPSMGSGTFTWNGNTMIFR